MCYKPSSQCSDPKRHEEYGYHEAGPTTIEAQLSDVTSWNPFSKEGREEAWTELTQERQGQALNAMMQMRRFEWDFDKLDIGR